jgi:putative ABC transport system ATP-binding protein
VAHGSVWTSRDNEAERAVRLSEITPLPIPFLHQHTTVMIKRYGANRRGLPRWEGASVNHTYGKSFVRLEAVSKAYGSGSSQLEVLNQVELELPHGETASLVGRSGSGKSTLLSLIAGLMRPDSGHVYIGGQQLDQMDDDARAELRAERIGFVLQSDNLIPFLTAVENVELAFGFAPARRATERARELLSDVGLGERMNHLPRQLSGGESQRVAIAVALANEPDLLLADEVVGQLDTATAADVMEMIFAASRDRRLTVLYVTHDEQLADRAHRTLRLIDHKVVPA